VENYIPAKWHWSFLLYVCSCLITACSLIWEYCTVVDRRAVYFQFCVQGTPGYIVFFSPSIVRFSQNILMKTGCLEPHTRVSFCCQIYSTLYCVKLVKLLRIDRMSSTKLRTKRRKHTDTTLKPIISGQLSLLPRLPSVGRETSTSQSVAMLCGWGVKAGWLFPYVDKRVDGR